MKTQSILSIALAAICASCSNGIDHLTTTNEEAILRPDYTEVTLPPNIAPITFDIEDSTSTAEAYAMMVVGQAHTEDTLWVYADGKSFDMGDIDWSETLRANAGGQIEMTICKREEGEWRALKPFGISIAAEDVDPVLVYRRIQPGYGLWNEMGIYERNLTTYAERAIYRNREGKYNCINCHSFRMQDPKQMIVHERGPVAGTFLRQDGKMTKLPIDTKALGMPAVYPAWHPQGRYVAFSQNKTYQIFHTHDKNRIEVIDDASDITIFDLETQTFINAEQLRRADSFETFPAFSADGTRLYFCTAAAVDTLPRYFKDVHYSLCSVSFDAQTGTIGSDIDTLYNARTEGGTVTFPRISPDGRWLAFTHADYGNFTIWHREADVWCMNLETKEIDKWDSLNSANVESYHSWSSNGRWIVVSSRRGDGLYTRPYISYVDANGKAHKPFIVPQRNAAHFYDWLMDSYNVPEFVKGEVE